MRIATQLLFLALVTALNVSAQTAASLAVKNFPADHFSISIPAGWVEIPKAELDKMAANVPEAVPNGRPQPFITAFRHPRNRPTRL